MDFHNKGYGKTVELLRPLINGALIKEGAEYKKCINEKHWTSVSDLSAALDLFEDDLPVCIMGFSPYKMKSMTQQFTEDFGLRTKLEVSCVPGYEYKGPGTITQKSPDGSIAITSQQSNFSDRAEELDRFTIGLSVSELREALPVADDNTKICAVIEDKDVEIIRVRQESAGDWISVDKPSPVMLEVADIWTEREFEIFRYD